MNQKTNPFGSLVELIKGTILDEAKLKEIDQKSSELVEITFAGSESFWEKVESSMAALMFLGREISAASAERNVPKVLFFTELQNDFFMKVSKSLNEQVRTIDPSQPSTEELEEKAKNKRENEG